MPGPFGKTIVGIVVCIVGIVTTGDSVRTGDDKRPRESGWDALHWPLLLLLFSHPVVSNSLWPHGLQHARLPSTVDRTIPDHSQSRKILPDLKNMTWHHLNWFLRPQTFLTSLLPVKWWSDTPVVWSWAFRSHNNRDKNAVTIPCLLKMNSDEIRKRPSINSKAKGIRKYGRPESARCPCCKKKSKK